MNEPVKSHGLTVFLSVHEAVARTRRWTALGFAALLGAFSTLAFAPFHLSPVLAISFTGLIWMIDGARGRDRWARAIFARGWAFGFGFFLVSLHWTVLPFLVEPEKHAAYFWMPLIVLPGGLGLIWGAACAVAGAFWSSSPSRVFIFGLFMGLAELVRGTLFGGFPWNIPGSSWAPGGALSQLASIGGIYWLTLVTLFIMASPAALVDTRDTRNVVGRVMPVLLAVIVIGGSWAWGAQRLQQPANMTEHTVVLMDAGVPQKEKFDEGGRPLLIRYANLLRSYPSEAGDIVILPEGAFGSYLLQDTAALDILSAFLDRRALIAGTARRTGPADAGTYYNSLAVFQSGPSSAELVALYDKHRLVPFGELAAAQIIPLGSQISAILPGAVQRLARAGFTPGSNPTVLLPEEIMPAFIPLICYEGLFPELVRKAAPQRDRAAWIVVISNDAWFGGGLGPDQHYAQNRYRAIESGLPLARVATRGTTAMVDAFGREVARGNPAPGDPPGWRSSVVRVPLPEPIESTPFQRFGPTLFWITTVFMAVLAILSWRR